MLNKAEKDQTGWLKVKGWVTSEIDSLRKKNDNPMSETETAMLRGEIKALNRVLSKAEPRELKTVPDKKVDY